MDFAMEYDYERYLESVLYEQEHLEKCVREALTLSEGITNSNNLEVFTESVGDKIKNGWNKFIAWLKKIWAKFVEMMSHTFSGVKEYLEKYKDIILKKKVKEGFVVDIPDHDVGIKRIFATQVEILQPADIEKMFNTAVTEVKKGNGAEVNAQNIDTTFAQSYGASWAPIQKLTKDSGVNVGDGTDVIRSNLKQYFLGGKERTVSTDTFNMTDLYNFCHDSEKLTGNLKKDETNFEKTCANVINVIETECKKLTDEAETAARNAKNNKNDENIPQPEEKTGNSDLDNAAQATQDAKVAEQKAGGTQGVTSNKSNRPNFNGTRHNQIIGNWKWDDHTKQWLHASFLYSDLYSSSIVLEADSLNIRQSGTGSTTTASGSAPTIGPGEASKTSRIKTGAADNNAYKAAGTAAGNAISNAGLTAENIQDAVKKFTSYMNYYKSVVGCVISAELDAANTICKNYMDIIRAHVRSYIGTAENPSDNTTIRSGTNYNGGQPQQQPQNTPAAQ